LEKAHVLVGIADVARHAGVSTATVSAVVNGTRYVSPERTEAVRRAIAELRYTPNGLARSLAQQRSGLIGLVIPSLTNPIYPDIVHPIQRILDGAGYSLVLCESQESEGQERAASELLRVRRVDGLIVAPSSVKNLDVLHEFHRAGVPVVLLNRRLGGPPFDRVVVDYAAATRAAVDHLVRLGRRRLALLALPNYEASTDGERDGRLIGYRSAIQEYGLADLSVVCEGAQPQQAAERAVLHLLRRRQPPDALIASNPSMTLGALEALRARHCSIPSDVALVGYGDLAWMRFVEPPLTVIDGAFEAVGQRAAELLLERLGGGGPEGSTEVTVQAHLVIRTSTVGLRPRVHPQIWDHAVSRTIDPPGGPPPARALRVRRAPRRGEFNLKGGSRPAT
jgi:LacI family transcriptional regulator, galactose operon repressor